jgi:phosphoserine aminotransferase
MTIATTERIFNFSAGPAVLPEQVLEKAKEELLNFQGSGMSIMEMSHRSQVYDEVILEVEAKIRRLLGVSDEYAVLFLQGGARLQFSMVPMNLAIKGQSIDVINTGSWTQQAIKELENRYDYNIVGSSEADNFTYIPKVGASDLNSAASYAYLTSNNTIFGTQFHDFPDTGNVPLVADMCSDIMSRPIDVNKFGLIFAGAQKNMGPAGVTIVIIKKSLADRADKSLPSMLQYRNHISKNSMFNTPPTFTIYMVGLVMEWLEQLGGLSAVQRLNEEKAGLLYNAIDESDFYYCPVKKESRSNMNIVFRVKDDNDALEKAFVTQATEKGLSGLKGHRSVGGLRASIYNAQSLSGVKALVDFMREFERGNS